MDRLLEGVVQPFSIFYRTSNSFLKSSSLRTPPLNCFNLFLSHASRDIFSHCKLPYVSFYPEHSSIWEFAVPPMTPPAPFPSPYVPAASPLLDLILTQQAPFSNGVSLCQSFTLSTAHWFPYHTPTKSSLTETYVCTSITPYLTETIFPLNKLYMAQPLIVKVLQHCYLFSECVNICFYTFSVCSFTHSPLCLSFGWAQETVQVIISRFGQ